MFGVCSLATGEAQLRLLALMFESFKSPAISEQQRGVKGRVLRSRDQKNLGISGPKRDPNLSA